jgi:hypothetical protein
LALLGLLLLLGLNIDLIIIIFKGFGGFFIAWFFGINLCRHGSNSNILLLITFIEEGFLEFIFSIFFFLDI